MRPPPGADSAAAASAPAPGAADTGGPTIKIESRTVVGDVTHLKGYFEGSALQAAGIYEGAQSVKPIKVDHVLGSQRVEFQLSLRDADIATNLRVIDQAGRVATASVFAEDSTAMASTGTESGVEVDRGTGATAGSNTAEIPSASAPASGLGGDAPASGLEESTPGADEGLDSGGMGSGLGGGGLSGGIGAPVGNVQINIESVNADAPADCAPTIIEALSQSCRKHELNFLPMVSRAYHDSLFIARIAPVAMLFIPCRNGYSHRPDEYAAPEDIVRGTLVLAETVATLSK